MMMMMRALSQIDEVLVICNAAVCQHGDGVVPQHSAAVLEMMMMFLTMMMKKAI